MEIGFEIAIKDQRGTYVWESEIIRALSDYFGVEVTAIEKVEITN